MAVLVKIENEETGVTTKFDVDSWFDIQKVINNLFYQVSESLEKIESEKDAETNQKIEELAEEEIKRRLSDIASDSGFEYDSLEDVIDRLDELEYILQNVRDAVD